MIVWKLITFFLLGSGYLFPVWMASLQVFPALLNPVLFLQPVVAGAATAANASTTQPLTFGSQLLLTSLWMPQELQSESHASYDRRPPPPMFPAPQQPEALPPLLPHGAIRWVKPAQDRVMVALTFDLCESAGAASGYDAPIVNYLRAENVHATFFTGGKWMRSHVDKAMQLIADPLFEIGNHSWTHENFRLITGAAVLNQIRWTQEQYAALRDELQGRAVQQGMAPALVQEEMARIPKVPVTFRFPYGTCNPEALQALGVQGLQPVQWDVVSGDPAPWQTSRQIVQTVLRQIRAGSIVVFHANGRGHGTAAALTTLIPALRARGFAFVTVSELLSAGEDSVAPQECYESRPGDNQRYDRLAHKGNRR